MSVPARIIPTEAVAVARRLYEQSNVPMEAIAGMVGINKRTLCRWVKDGAWAMRSRRLPIVVPAEAASEPMAAAADVLTAGSPSPAAAPVPRRELIARIETEIAAVERLLAKAGFDAGTDSAADTERAARTLAVLVRSLRELAAIERGQAPDNEEAERDADAYRRELEATLERVLAGGAAA